MTNSKQYDLEDRTLEFSKRIIGLCKELPVNFVNKRLLDQCVRSGTSLGANYREANETETKKDFQYRIRICRKEAKETIYWLKLIAESNTGFESKLKALIKETEELMKIFASILQKCL